jgi:transposase
MEGYNVLDRKEDQHDMVITAEFAKPVEFCVRCGLDSPPLKRHGVQIQHFLDTPIHGKRSMIQVRRQRYKCLECDKTFFQPLYFMDDKRQMTTRLLHHIQRLSLERTFTQVASDVGLDEKTIRNIFFDHIRNLNSGWMPETPVWLGIDELFLIRKPRCMLTNVAVNTVVDILPDRNKPTVKKWLSELMEPERVKVVTMDMWTPYRDAVLDVLPHAVCIVDKFHVVKLANHALDAIRKTFREGLDLKGRRKLLRSRHLILRRRHDLRPEEFRAMQEWTDSVPVLFNAYQAKEDFFQIYDCQTKAEAMDLYDTWKECLDPATKAAFFEVIRAVDNWRPEIFNYFDTPVTNAYTEAVNGMAKVANRMGRGYSFEAIRAKVLFGAAKHVERPKPFSGVVECFLRSTVDCGVSLPHLVELFSNGH